MFSYIYLFKVEVLDIFGLKCTWFLCVFLSCHKEKKYYLQTFCIVFIDISYFIFFWKKISCECAEARYVELPIGRPSFTDQSRSQTDLVTALSKTIKLRLINENYIFRRYNLLEQTMIFLKMKEIGPI